MFDEPLPKILLVPYDVYSSLHRFAARNHYLDVVAVVLDMSDLRDSASPSLRPPS